MTLVLQKYCFGLPDTVTTIEVLMPNMSFLGTHTYLCIEWAIVLVCYAFYLCYLQDGWLGLFPRYFGSINMTIVFFKKGWSCYNPDNNGPLLVFTVIFIIHDFLVLGVFMVFGCVSVYVLQYFDSKTFVLDVLE